MIVVKWLFSYFLPHCWIGCQIHHCVVICRGWLWKQIKESCKCSLGSIQTVLFAEEVSSLSEMTQMYLSSSHDKSCSNSLNTKERTFGYYLIQHRKQCIVLHEKKLKIPFVELLFTATFKATLDYSHSVVLTGIQIGKYEDSRVRVSSLKQSFIPF